MVPSTEPTTDKPDTKSDFHAKCSQPQAISTLSLPSTPNPQSARYRYRSHSPRSSHSSRTASSSRYSDGSPRPLQLLASVARYLGTASTFPQPRHKESLSSSRDMSTDSLPSSGYFESGSPYRHSYHPSYRSPQNSPVKSRFTLREATWDSDSDSDEGSDDDATPPSENDRMLVDSQGELRLSTKSDSEEYISPPEPDSRTTQSTDCSLKSNTPSASVNYARTPARHLKPNHIQVNQETTDRGLLSNGSEEHILLSRSECSRTCSTPTESSTCDPATGNSDNHQDTGISEPKNRDMGRHRISIAHLCSYELVPSMATAKSSRGLFPNLRPMPLSEADTYSQPTGVTDTTMPGSMNICPQQHVSLTPTMPVGTTTEIRADRQDLNSAMIIPPGVSRSALDGFNGNLSSNVNSANPFKSVEISRGLSNGRYSRAMRKGISIELVKVGPLDEAKVKEHRYVKLKGYRFAAVETPSKSRRRLQRQNPEPGMPIDTSMDDVDFIQYSYPVTRRN